MTVGRLSAIETAYVELAGRGTPIQIGSVGVFEGGPLVDRRGRFRLEEVRTRVASRLHLLPRLRQRIAGSPGGLARPVWVDATDFDIADHVEVVSLNRPLDESALLELAADLLSTPLDPYHPPWHLCFVTGLEGGRVALVERASHALIDGVSGVDLAVVLLDIGPEAEAVDAPEWRPAPEPSTAASIAGAIVDHARVPRQILAGAVQALRHPSTLSPRLHAATTVVEAAVQGGLAPRSSLNRPIGPSRSLRVVRTDLAALKAAGRPYGATVNDVVLTAVTGGLRALLLGRGDELPSDLELKALVPVSLRSVDQRGSLGNRVGGLVFPLPVGMGDPTTRLRAVVSAGRHLKASGEATASQALLDAADVLPAPAIGAATRLLDHQRLINLVVTNVPGPDGPLYVLGARLLEAVPMVPLAGNLTLGVAVLSYCGQVTLGITADTATCPDVDVFTQGVEHSLDTLLADGEATRAQRRDRGTPSGRRRRSRPPSAAGRS